MGCAKASVRRFEPDRYQFASALSLGRTGTYDLTKHEIIVGDVRTTLAGLAPGSVQTCVTSPPYFGLRDYGHDGQIGLEGSVAEYVDSLVNVFRDVRAVLRKDGTLWLNLGDTRKDGFLLGVPWRAAYALVADGWLLVNDVVWQKPNVSPVNAPRRLTTDHEMLFLFAKTKSYSFDSSAILEPLSPASLGRYKYAFSNNAEIAGRTALASSPASGVRTLPSGRRKRTVWKIASPGARGKHFATFPPKLIEPCILAGSRAGDTVLDPFGGSGTTAIVAKAHGRNSILCELNPEYAEMARARTEAA